MDSKKVIINIDSLLSESILKGITYNTRNGRFLSTGEVYQVVAPARTGKSVFVTEMCLQATQGRTKNNTLYINVGEIEENQFFSRLVSLSYWGGVESSLDSIDKFSASVASKTYDTEEQADCVEKHIQDMVKCNGKVIFNRMESGLVPLNQKSLDVLMYELLNVLKYKQIDVLIFDGLDRIFVDGDYGEKTQFLQLLVEELQRYARMYNMLIITTIQAKEKGVTPYTKALDNIVDGAFYL